MWKIIIFIRHVQGDIGSMFNYEYNAQSTCSIEVLTDKIAKMSRCIEYSWINPSVDVHNIFRRLEDAFKLYIDYSITSSLVEYCQMTS